MKILIFILLSIISTLNCFADSNTVAPDTKWTHSWSEGEDATSTFYYFFEDRGEVSRIRMMWNGGAQNKPTVEDFIFESGIIKIVSQEADRKNITDLILGKNTGLKVLSQTKILRRSTDMMLVPELPRKSLNKNERIHLSNILDLLLRDRTPYKIKPIKMQNKAQ